MAQILDSEPLLTPKKIETWAGTKLDTVNPLKKPAGINIFHAQYC